MECQLPPTCSHTPMVKGLCQQQRLVAPVVPLQVAHLLLCPQLHHLTGITPTVACLETEIAHHVPLAVLEHKDGGFVNLDGQLFTIRAYSMVHVCLTRTRVASGVP